MHVVSDRLHAPPTWRHRAEHVPRGLAQLICLAVTATEEEHQQVGRQVLDRYLDRLRHHWVLQATVGDGPVDVKREVACWRDQPPALVAEHVDVGGGGNEGLSAKRSLRANVGAMLGVDIKQADHRRWVHNADGDLVSVVDEHL